MARNDEDELIETPTNEFIEKMEKGCDPQYNGYGTEDFLITGTSQFRARAQYNGILDRKCDVSLPDGEIADVVVSENIWSDLNDSYKEEMERFETFDQHYPMGFNVETNDEIRSYTGFLKVDESGYPVIIETEINEDPVPEGSEIIGYTLPNLETLKTKV